MAIDFRNLAPSFEAASRVADAGAIVLPVPADSVARFMAAGLRFAADLAKKGVDPVEHIERIHAAEPLLSEVEKGWADALRKKFGG